MQQSLRAMRTSDLIKEYYDIVSKLEKYQNVPISIFKELYANSKPDYRLVLRKDMIDTIIAYRRKQSLEKIKNQK